MSNYGPEPDYYAKRLKVLRKTVKSVSGGYGIQSPDTYALLRAVVAELRKMADTIEKDVHNAELREGSIINGR